MIYLKVAMPAQETTEETLFFISSNTGSAVLNPWEHFVSMSFKYSVLAAYLSTYS